MLSSFKQPCPPSFEKFKARNNLLLKKKDVYLIDYDVNLDSVAKSLGKRGKKPNKPSAFVLKVHEET